MPIYEYQCTVCGKQVEVFQRITDDPLTQCESCSGSLVKLVSQTSFVLKGGGWYKDGYASSKAGDTSSAGNGKKAAGSGNGSPKKPATKKQTVGAAG